MRKGSPKIQFRLPSMKRSSYEELDGINIMTDARHRWRKNSKDTSVVALGEKKRTQLWIVFMSLRLEILLHKDMK